MLFTLYKKSNNSPAGFNFPHGELIPRTTKSGQASNKKRWMTDVGVCRLPTADLELAVDNVVVVVPDGGDGGDGDDETKTSAVLVFLSRTRRERI